VNFGRARAFEVFVRVLLFILTFALTGCAGLHQDGPPVITSNGVTIERVALEARIHELVNQERQGRGLSAVDWNEAIRPIARGHSTHMGRRNYFSHNAPNGADFNDRYRRARFGCQVPAGRNRYLLGGENLFMGHVVRSWTAYSDGSRVVTSRHDLESLARAAVTGWMNSPAHRDNLLNRHWRTEAIGIEITEDGRVYATQNFC
jgi:uncharacterized protein YkwD